MENNANGTFADERDVVGVLLGLLYVGEGQVVRSYTRGGLGMPSDEARMRDFLRNNLEGLEKETVEDFRRKNQRRHPVQPDLDADGRLVAVGDEDFARIFRDREGWTRFRETYPDSDGTLRISRVGFDRGLGQALVYAGQQFDWDTGLSGFWLLSKRDGAWTEAARVGNEVS